MQKNNQELPSTEAQSKTDIQPMKLGWQSESTVKIDKQLAKAQAEMVGAKKGSTNPFFNSSYADLSEVINAVSKPLTNNGINYTTTCTKIHVVGDSIFVNVMTRLRYEGEWISCVVPIPIEGKPNAHKLGSALTYGRRYGLSAITGCPQLDDDGNATIDTRPNTNTRVYNSQAQKVGKQ